MKAWLIKQWLDESVFIGNVRWAMFILAGLFSTNQIPTGFNGGGAIVAALLTAFAVKMAAGDKTSTVARESIDAQVSEAVETAVADSAVVAIAAAVIPDNPKIVSRK